MGVLVEQFDARRRVDDTKVLAAVGQAVQPCDFEREIGVADFHIDRGTRQRLHLVHRRLVQGRAGTGRDHYLYRDLAVGEPIDDKRLRQNRDRDNGTSRLRCLIVVAGGDAERDQHCETAGEPPANV